MTDSRVESDRGASASINTSLLARLKGDSPEAWNRFVHLFGPLVYQWCREQGLQAADTGDVGQEVFRTVALRIGSFRRDRPCDTFRGWLWTITRSRLADYWRSRRNAPVAAGGSSAQVRLANVVAAESTQPPDLEKPGVQSSLYQRGLELIRGEFEPSSWQAFWRVAVDGCKPADVAKELDQSVNAVYLAKSRVLRRLRDELGEFLD